MTEPRHLLVYIRRRLGAGRGAPVQLGNFAELSLVQPGGHGFGQRWLFELAQTGQPLVVWLFSVMRHQQWCLPPALDARIEVNRAFDQAGAAHAPPYVQWLLQHQRFAYAFEPTLAPLSAPAQTDLPGTCYLPWNHFGPTLRQMIPHAAMPDTASELQPSSAYAAALQHFQTPRHLTPANVARLEAYARAVWAMPKGFVSYRRKEAPVLAMQAAARLFHHGFAPWWDQWAMPRKVAEEEALCASAAVEATLHAAIDASHCALSIHSASYGQSQCTQKELERITQADHLVHLQLRSSVPLPITPEATKALVDLTLGQMHWPDTSQTPTTNGGFGPTR